MPLTMVICSHEKLKNNIYIYIKEQITCKEIIRKTTDFYLVIIKGRR